MTIVNYYPKDDENTIYMPYTSTLEEIIDKAREMWGPIELDEITVRAEHIHTRCIGYDLYDGSDYDDFVVIEKVKY